MKHLLPFVLCLGVLFSGAAAWAQDTTSTLPKTSRSTFLKLMAVQKLWEEEDYPAAIAELEEHAASVRDDPYEYALTNQYLANTAILAGDNNRAKLAVEQALSAGALPAQMKANLDLFYGQLLIGDEEFEKALTHLEDWLAVTQTPPQPGQIFYVAYANFMMEKLPRAQTLIERAIDEQPEHSEQWDRIYYQILYDQRKYDEALDVVLGLLNRGPANDGYWRLLVNHYMSQEESRNALAAMVIANLQNPMTQEADLKRLVSLYGYVEIPEKAARLLEAYIASESITKDPETLRQLGDLWLMARERDKAKVVLQEAAQVAPDGRTYQLLGGIFFEDEQWEDAYKAYLEALDLGGLTDPDQIQLLVGISAYRAGMMPEARVALEAASKSDEYRSQAQSLLRRL